MLSLPHLETIHRYRITFKNWLSVLNLLRRNNKGILSTDFQFLLKFRDNSTLIVTHPSSIYVALGYYIASNGMNSYSYSDLKKLILLSDRLNHEIEAVFGSKDFKLFPSQKDGIIFALVRKFKPQIFVETGVAYGNSSSIILQALHLNGTGRLISIDLPNINKSGYTYEDGTNDPIFIPNDKEPGWIVPAELRDLWTLELGKSSDVLPKINNTIDMFLHDSEHSYDNMFFEFEWAYEHLSPNGVLCSDDINWNNAYFDFVKKHSFADVFPRSISYGIARKK